MMKGIPKRKTREEILELSAPLFAQHGYDGVSMRDVAAVVGLTQAALYYYFSDKDQLYLDAVAYQFRERELALKDLLAGNGAPWERLERFVAGLARMMAADKDFPRLMQWVLLDTDETRQSTLAKHVFRDMFVAVHDLASKLDPHQDAHMLAMSILGLVIFHFQTGATRKFMPGHRPHQDKPEVLARHVCELLRRSLAAADGDAG
ncbi:TetR/AcrR family transcriptional regulator [Acidithiobacillus sp.]|jgi:AcrR family transcriptional regulator|uniref:TetR/AcrR family transcriptional regulator n=1 Tax=Acidithiobacillus sp. TaxID=1872118 RepID=UPI00355EABD0